MPGVTPQGFERPRLPEIRQEIVDDITSRLRARGYTDAIETRPDSLMGLLIDTFAERETALWEQSEAVYYAMYPNSATGAQLDRAVSFTGVSRIQAEPSNGYVILYGAEGTLVPAESQVRNRVTQTIWQTVADVTIGAGAAGDAQIRPTALNSTLYRVTIDGIAYSYTSDASATIGEILAGLTLAVAPSGFTVTNDGAVLRIVADGRDSFTLQVTANMTVVTLGTPARVESLETGATTGEIGELTEIVTLVPGWNSVNNLQAAALGRDAESDAELRARYTSGVYALGAATLPALQANLEARVEGIRTVKVFENDSDVTDGDGRPPHSIHVVARGGLDQDIAQVIFDYKAAGIDTHGAVEVEIIDSEGVSHDIHFDRPTPYYIWVDATITLLPESEETFPPDGLTQIANNLLAAGNALGVGQDVIWQRLLSAIHAVPGVAEAVLLLGSKSSPGGPAPAMAEANITIPAYGIAVFDTSRIEVT